eukprot:m.483290 g.483290  ORF g.483290 m.483290 type:complete len:182 (+) comp22872_c0_seq1:244-789(+)
MMLPLLRSLLRPDTRPRVFIQQLATMANPLASTVLCPFHLAIPVHDMAAAREFYGNVLGLTEGRRAGDKWQDYSLNGHQLVCHWAGDSYRCSDHFNPVDGDEVPVPHFGLALSLEQFQTLAERVKPHVKFIIEPHLRFKGQPGEQYTMFFKDPSGNNLEFKAMSKPENLFARYDINDDKTE